MAKYEVVPGRGKVRVDDGQNMICLTNDMGSERRETMYEHVRSQVYATGNKWAIENFHATHD